MGMESTVTTRKHIACKPAEVQVGDILCQKVTTSVDPRGSGHGSGSVDIGLVVGEPYAYAIEVRRMGGKESIYEPRMAFEIQNPWGEVESVRGMHTWDLVTVRRNQ